ncbi:MAG TPA: phosphatase PAP2 family protein [Gaiellaceae bacterium]|nr:phosphatase PAP2 family protein [Gaiellaceae bacterium]
MTPGPEAGDLRIPPLVRGEWRVKERQAEGDPEQREAERRWGPPCPDLTRVRLAAAIASLAVALGFAVWQVGLGLTPDRYLLVLLVPALVLGQPRKYLADFVPFAVLLVVYSVCRGVAHLIHPAPFARPQLSVERFLFAGHLPTAELEHLLGTAHHSLPAHAAVLMTRLHFIVPPLLGFALWVKRRALFYRFAATMVVLSFAACLVFLLYPSAPPWAASDRHLTTPLVHLTRPSATVSAGASGLASASVTRLVPKNNYAAIPSLHAGYAFVVLLFAGALAGRSRWRRPIVGVALVYALLQATAVVYTADHYVVDVLLGFAAATLAYLGVNRVWRARALPD